MRTPWSDELAYLLQWLTGHILSSIDQLSVGGKSPLTGGVNESNSGGTTGLQIAVAGYDSIGACIFAAFGFAAAPPETLRDFINARYGWDVDITI
jgi:aldehyde:ferredoxin oxidoreductase